MIVSACTKCPQRGVVVPRAIVHQPDPGIATLPRVAVAGRHRTPGIQGLSSSIGQGVARSPTRRVVIATGLSAHHYELTHTMLTKP